MDLTPEQRASHARDLLNNPLLRDIFDRLERDATETCIYADSDENRARAAMRVQAIRSFRSDCEGQLHSDRKRKAAPA